MVWMRPLVGRAAILSTTVNWLLANQLLVFHRVVTVVPSCCLLPTAAIHSCLLAGSKQQLVQLCHCRQQAPSPCLTFASGGWVAHHHSSRNASEACEFCIARMRCGQNNSIITSCLVVALLISAASTALQPR
jgi:hypothetical protein